MKNKLPLIVGAVVIVAVLAFVVGRMTVGNTPKDAGKPSWTRNEFRTLVIGKTPKQVIEAVGKPNITQEGSYDNTWFYDNVKDEITGKQGTAIISIRNGAVESVHFGG